MRAANKAVHAARGHIEGRRMVRLIVGMVLLGIGLVGLLMPILPGWLLIFVGLAVLGVRPQFIERLKERARQKTKAPTPGGRPQG